MFANSNEFIYVKAGKQCARENNTAMKRNPNQEKNNTK